MGESLGVSVSFGKYENDAALSWEKWSTFSPNNKYLEEVGKCSTPGSVAQKKAFFEAHYKKIAAMKAEADLLLEDDDDGDDGKDFQQDCNYLQEPQISPIELQPQDNDDGSMQPPSPTTLNSNAHKLEEEETVLVNDDEMTIKQQSPTSSNSNAHKLEEKEADLVIDESMKHDFQVGDVQPSQSPTTLNSNAEKLQESAAVLVNDEVQPSQSPRTLNSNADKLQEAVLVNHESMKLVKQHFQVDLETTEVIPKQKAQNMTKKINPNKVEKNPIGMKKKPAASLIPKTPETLASRLSKPKPKPKAASASSVKKPSTPLPSKKTYHSVSETRHFTPVSLHLSMNMNSVNSDTASSVTSSRRRSLFMEQMGDKDIVKRAFKTFQNRVNQLPAHNIEPKQLPAKRPEQKTSTSGAYQKENERSRKAVEKINPARGQLGPKWKSVSSASLKEVGVDERRLKAGPTSLALKSNERAERRKEFFKNLEEKSNAREAERSQLSLKSKEVKDAEMKKPKQNLKYKAKRVPNFSQSQGALKNTSDKQETIKNRTTR
ncbi:hypothetical protein SSX86_020978 [Deinandra increscens subsp. villosa]|uniref:TPX2 C-terminal domain-containing protein n=1 Tax=Deinandra increscens subsp. villosa TaxID=3103831 RepID=A0AAP0CP10_9ASTR